MNGDAYSRDGGRSGGGSRNYSSRDDRRGDDRGDRGERRRRRSRSPGHRGGGSRRDYEVDTYSSSRDYREREREDTYARRERRDDRGWGDSYSRRDHPRRDDDRGYGGGGRRDRDGGHEERGDRGGGGGGGRGRRGDRGDRDGGFGGGRERKKSASPPVKKREPTPDLTTTTSIQERQRRMTQWDIKPAGYDSITAEQAKLSGMFPLPGAPRPAQMDPSKVAAFLAPTAGSATASSLQPHNAKQAKRLFIYNIPAQSTSETLVDFFNIQLNGLNVVSGNDPCISAQVSADKEYALLEFKTTEDATMALALDGISTEEESSGPDRPGLSIRRPKDYIVPTTNEDTDQMEGVISSVVPDSPNKLSIVNIPTYVDDAQIKELLEAFGPLKAFVMVKDTGSDQNRGVAFCEYAQTDTIEQVIEGLNTIALGDTNLKVQHASVGVTQAAGLDGGVGAISLLAGSSANEGQDTTRVIMLLNMVTHDELLDYETYEEIKEDVEEECAKYGEILQVKVPRPTGARVNPGVGKIFIKYADTESAQKAIRALAGRQFASRTVVATHFSEENFNVDAW